MFIYQYGSQNVSKTVEMVTEPSAKYNDMNNNLSLVTENSGERERIKYNTVKYTIPK